VPEDAARGCEQQQLGDPQGRAPLAVAVATSATTGQRVAVREVCQQVLVCLVVTALEERGFGATFSSEYAMAPTQPASRPR
jgi:hypothetical protein